MMKYDGDLREDINLFYDSIMVEYCKVLFEDQDFKNINCRMEVIGIFNTLPDNWPH